MKKRPEQKKPPIGIFRHTLLPPSETFIAEQAKNITGFEVHYFGREKGHGKFNLADCHLIQQPTENRLFKRGWYTLTGRSGRLFKELKSVAPVLLHAHFGVEGVYALPFAKRLGIPLITTFHGYDATKGKYNMLKSWKLSWIRYIAKMDGLRRNGALFIAVSDFIRTQLIARDFPPERIVVHYIGVDPERFKTGNACDDGKTILTVGRLVEQKGTEYLIKAMARIQRDVPDVGLEIVGDGPLLPSLERLAAKLGLSSKVVFRKALVHDKVARSMQRASVFCLPSVTAEAGDTEGLGLVLLEAAASTKPVVGTLHGGIPEAVRDGENGFLVPERDVDALANRLILLLKSRELRQKMGEAGRTLVKDEFNIKKQTKKLEQIYGNVLLREFGYYQK